MCGGVTYAQVIGPIHSVHDENGVPTGVVAFEPFTKVGDHTVSLGATGEGEQKIFGVVIDGDLLPDHRSETFPPSSSLVIQGDKVLFKGAQVASLKLA